PPTEISTLSLHDALPISHDRGIPENPRPRAGVAGRIDPLSLLCLGANDPADAPADGLPLRESPPVRSHHRIGLQSPVGASRTARDRKSTRLNSSHVSISY